MKFSLLPLPLALLSIVASPAVRADFNPSLVSGDARWVVYIDLNSLRTNPLGKEAIAAIQAQAAGAAPLPGGGSLTIDVPKVMATIGSITAYGANFEKDPGRVDGTLVVQGTPDLRKIVEAVLLEMEVGPGAMVTDVKGLGYSAYAFTRKDQADPGLDHPVIIAFPPDGTVIVSQTEFKVRKAYDLIRGRGESLAQAHGSDLTAMTRDAAQAMLFAASDIPPDLVAAAERKNSGPHTRILEMTHSASVAIGDADGKTFVHAELFAADDDSADKLTKILQGMTAMLSLTQSNNQKMTDFINSAQAVRDGDRVSFQLAYDSNELAAMAKGFLDTRANEPHDGPRIVAPGPTARWERILGHQVAEWKVLPPASTSSGIAGPLWQDIPGVKLANGARVTMVVFGDQEHAADHFETLQVKPDGPGAPLTFNRRMLTEGHHPLLSGFGPGAHLLHLDFPGEDGTYTIRVRYTQPAQGNVSFQVWVKNDTGSDNPPLPPPPS
ncbi:MAG TPA: hypothetical protein VGL42_16555 [Opitutaceae bacterium]|jgi:hypothetical protein